MKHFLDVKISKAEWEKQTPEERDMFVKSMWDAMTPKQILQMVKMGKSILEDGVPTDSRTPLQDMARMVGVTINGTKNNS